MGPNDFNNPHVNNPWFFPPTYSQPSPSQPTSPGIQFPKFSPPPAVESPGKQAGSSGSSGGRHRHSDDADVVRAAPRISSPARTQYANEDGTVAISGDLDDDEGFARVANRVMRIVFPLRWLWNIGRWLSACGSIFRTAVVCCGALIAWQWPVVASHGVDKNPDWLLIALGAAAGWFGPRLLGKLIVLTVNLIVVVLLVATLGAIGYGAWLGFSHFIR
jgi:hypothetical protein